MSIINLRIDPGPVTRERYRILRQAVLDTVRHLIEMPDADLKLIGMGLKRSVEEMEQERHWQDAT